MKTSARPACRATRMSLAAGLMLLSAWAQAQATQPEAWVHAKSDLRLGYETLKLPGNESMGLLGTSYLLEVAPGVCFGPGVYSALSGQRGGLFVVGAEAALCMPLAGPLSLQAGLYVGGGGGGGAPVGGGLMLRPHADLLWDFGGLRAGVSYSNVRFPSGQINSSQFGLVLDMSTDFNYLSPARGTLAFDGSGRTGMGFDRILMVGGVYRPRAGSLGNSGVPLQSQIGYVGARAERFFTPNLYGGLEANGAASGGAAGYAEFLGTLGAEFAPGSDAFTLGARVALGMGGGGDIPTGGGLLAKAALDASLRLSRDLSLGLEAGWAKAPQGSFSAPFGSIALRWDLDHADGPPTNLAREEWAGGVETYHLAARKQGPPQSLQNVTLKFNRFVGDTVYLSGQVHSAYAGDAGAFSVGLVGAGAQWRIGEMWLVGAELLGGAAGGGGVATGSGAIVQPMAYVGVELSPSLYLRLGGGQVKAINGPLDSHVADLTLVFSFGVASRP
jgi:hypothetical protein